MTDKNAVVDRFDKRLHDARPRWEQLWNRPLEPADRTRINNFREAFDQYLRDRAPEKGAAREMFLANMAVWLDSLDGKKLRDLGDKAGERYRMELRGDFFTPLDTVAFYTVASEEVLQQGGKDAWSRVPEDQARLAAQKTDWASARDRFDAVANATRRRWSSEHSPSREGPDKAIKDMRERLSRLYGNTGNQLTDAMADDLARIHWLMRATEQDESGRPSRRVSRYLEPLSKDVGEVPPNPPVDQAKLSKAAIVELLAAREKDFGFRTDPMVCTGLLPPEEFAVVTRAGYMPDDIGAGLEHGSMTHRMQWYAVMADYEENPHAWNHVPLELYTNMGDFDLRREQLNKSRFEFERVSSVWAQVMDQMGRPNDSKDMTYVQPDNLRAILKHEHENLKKHPGSTNERTSLGNLYDHIDVTYLDRRDKGLSSTGIDDSRFVEEVKAELLTKGHYQPVHVDGKRLELYLPAGREYHRDPDREAIRKQRTRRKDREPARPDGQDAPRHESHHEAARADDSRTSVSRRRDGEDGVEGPPLPGGDRPPSQRERFGQVARVGRDETEDETRADRTGRDDRGTDLDRDGDQERDGRDRERPHERVVLDHATDMHT